MARVRSIPGKRNAFFLDATCTPKELWQALDELWDISMQRHNAEVTLQCAMIRIHLNATYMTADMKKLAAMHAEELSKLAAQKQRPESPIEVRL